MINYLNDKGLHDFEKRMIISKLLGGGGAAAPSSPGCYGPGGSLNQTKQDNWTSTANLLWRMIARTTRLVKITKALMC
jgi:hypothetical protein